MQSPLPLVRLVVAACVSIRALSLHHVTTSPPCCSSAPPAGLFLSSLALHLHSQAQRFVPEPLAFAVQMLQGALPAGCAPAAAGSSSSSSHQRQLDADDPRWLVIHASEAGAGSLPANPEDIPALELARLLSSDESSEGGGDYWRSAGFKTSAAAAAVRLVARSAELLAGNAALPAILAPAQAALRAIVQAAEAAAPQQQQRQQAAAAVAPASSKKKQRKQKEREQRGEAAATTPSQPPVILAPGLVELCRSTLAALDAAAASAASSRRPLYNMALLKVAEKKQYNPRFEEDFVSGKDYDPDRCARVCTCSFSGNASCAAAGRAGGPQTNESAHAPRLGTRAWFALHWPAMTTSAPGSPFPVRRTQPLPPCACRERSERRKLQRALRREERGAARELRRDAGGRGTCRCGSRPSLLRLPLPLLPRSVLRTGSQHAWGRIVLGRAHPPALLNAPPCSFHGRGSGPREGCKAGRAVCLRWVLPPWALSCSQRQAASIPCDAALPCSLSPQKNVVYKEESGHCFCVLACSLCRCCCEHLVLMPCSPSLPRRRREACQVFPAAATGGLQVWRPGGHVETQEEVTAPNLPHAARMPPVNAATIASGRGCGSWAVEGE